MINVCYYVTGHGLGHATRSVELVIGLLLSNLFRVYVVTNVPETFFLHCLAERNVSITGADGLPVFKHFARVLDTGAVQTDVFKVDALGSLEKYHRLIHSHRDALLKHEVSWLRAEHVGLVLADATPLGCAAGRAAGAKVVLVTNFTWDFVYREMLDLIVRRQETDSALCTEEHIAAFRHMVEQCTADTSSADLYLQYPGRTPLPVGFSPQRVVAGPLMARSPSQSAADLRTTLGVAPADKVLLLGFGGHDMKWELRDEFLPPGWVCFILGHKAGEPLPSSRFREVSFDFYVPDLIAAADAVLGKIGYGFVSECLSSGTGLVYVPRSDWPEERFVEALLCDTYDAGVHMPMSDFVTGNWTEYITRAQSKRYSWVVDPAANSTVAVERILETLQSVLRS